MHLLRDSDTMKKVMEVSAAKSETSSTFCHDFLIVRLRSFKRHIWTRIKIAPMMPQTKPIMTAPDSSYSGIGCSSGMIPNLSTAASDKVTGLLLYSDVKIPSTNVLPAEQKKFLHRRLKVQNVFGVDISYANRAPPIGAPNATATPADTPAAMNSRLRISV